MYSTGAAAIVSGRPFSSLAGVAALDGVGTSSLQALKTWAPTWGVQSPTLAEVQAALTAASAGIWFPSETDAHIAVLTGTQLNGAAITVDAIRAQLTVQHDQLIESVRYTGQVET